ncbi:uncharacterized protein LACBIDRAFT_317392 [Laccaria bicolor S238N-H82]|uniref:Predicted protein n=1 Tax=Laccaria bicolor (strain S238N-H82 / ATCC MYA-4686) TaxID=486041 RepID=B0D531_LACBS|nr:uncharacterized protein LACBIDRAFT_317392 [Laccaria bicolor S238N-H82]EDR10451.1 predicted protein [Laccaria bicolor S238N-H82]|eukprot:XP_001878901.1 predicted protein [Laccaria bicolor S238N-H82]
MISPHVEHCTTQLITRGACHNAMDVQCELFPHLNPATVCKMFIRKGLNGRICRKKRWLSRKHI